MSGIIRQLFELAEAEGTFDTADAMLNNECEKRLQAYKECLQGTDYEQIRDTVYSISYLSKQSAFEAGFQTAVKLIMECMSHDRTT